ncbi:MAG: AI-2E family transporter [Oleiphilaceae bacterium]|nr:AI-2E family transporter [Oleiphilaceae bacterium]
MRKLLRSLAVKYFSDEEAVVLFLILVAALLAVVFLGNILGPVIAALIIAFILQGLVSKLKALGLPHLVSVLSVFVLFVGVLVSFIFGMLPLIWTQISALAVELPRMIRATQRYLEVLPQEYPQLVSIEEVNALFQQITSEVGKVTQWLVSFSLESISNLVVLLIYLVLVPILVFFFLKDRDQILAALSRLLPSRRPLMNTIWNEMNLQFANYVRGKALEILIVGAVTFLSFTLLGLNYSLLLALLVGMSVVIPYIGAAVVTVPVAMIGLFQFGWSPEFFWLIAIYFTIQALDGNVLVPLLFSEVVDLHPVVIILAVLFFGGIWGLWGVFFAIPLATLVNAIIKAWPVVEVPPGDVMGVASGKAADYSRPPMPEDPPGGG